VFLALRELKHSRLRYALIGGIVMLIAWLVFPLAGLANALALDNASALINMDAD
jgi:putative ABC transport system permease protein